MKKLILMASAALAFGGVAYAQDTTAPATGTTAPDASQPATTPDASAQPPASDASAPVPDASSAPADATGAAPQPGTATGPNGPVSTTPTQGPSDLPKCSKTVTDNCQQGAGPSKSATHHRAARHHKK